MKLLIAEDNFDISKALVTLFEKNGYSAQAVYNGKDALYHAMNGDYDGIILDIMMPEYDGIEVLSKIRKDHITTPVLILTAKSKVSDRVLGLDSGADDYLPKPFSMSELLSRVRAMLRRRSDYQPDIVVYNEVKFNKGTLELEYRSEKIRLVTREFQVFELLIENAGQVIPTDTMIQRIWGWDSDVDVSIVWVTISNIRKKLQSINAPLHIHAVRGIGYQLEKNNDQ